MKDYRPTIGATPFGELSPLEIPDLRGLGLVVAVALNVVLWAGIGATVWAVIS
ncbi:MAG TPA: hypothetical protein VEB21_05595 [Terriglobales bacterium]|nr:hypothetical protein [Terriglobales bacterium]